MRKRIFPALLFYSFLLNIHPNPNRSCETNYHSQNLYCYFLFRGSHLLRTSQALLLTGLLRQTSLASRSEELLKRHIFQTSVQILFCNNSSLSARAGSVNILVHASQILHQTPKYLYDFAQSYAMNFPELKLRQKKHT